jgi:Sec-independent protein translocase protein TatA
MKEERREVGAGLAGHEWIEEGIRQICLGACWCRYAALLKAAGAPPELVGGLDNLAPSFLAPPWLPGAREVVADLLAIPGSPSTPLPTPTWTRAFTAWLSSANTDPPTVGDASNSERERFSVWVRECGRKAQQGEPPGGATVTPGWPEEPSPGQRTMFWIEQACVLERWHAQASERARIQQASGAREPYSQWRSEVEELQKRVEEVRHPQRLSFFGRGRLPEWVPDIGNVLERMRKLIDHLESTAEKSDLAQILDELERQTTEILKAQPTSWPPARLEALRQDLAQFTPRCGGSLLRDLLARSKRMETAWLDELGKMRPGLTADGQARVLLARLLVEALPWPADPGPMARVLQPVLRSLTEMAGSRVELVYDLNGTHDPGLFQWREGPGGASLCLSPGLALGTEGQAWQGFPRARLEVPPLHQGLSLIRDRLLAGDLAGNMLLDLARDLLGVIEALPARWEELSPELNTRMVRLVRYMRAESSPERRVERPEPENHAEPLRLSTLGTPLSTALPPPPEFPGESGCPALNAPLLRRWHQGQAKGAQGKEVADREERRTQEEFKSWIGTEAGVPWFDRLVRAALDDQGPGGTLASPPSRSASPTEARSWLGFLLGAGWCGCYPSVNLETGKVFWAGGESLPEALTWEFSDKPPGTVLEVDRFAPMARGARCVFSQGPRGADRALEAAFRIQEKLPSGGEALAPFEEPARGLVQIARQRLVGALPVPRAVESRESRVQSQKERQQMTLAGERGASAPCALDSPLSTLDCFVKALQKVSRARVPGQGAEADQVLDEILAEVRTWAEVFEMEILPRRWTFRETLAQADLAPDEVQGMVVDFSSAVPSGQVSGVKSFGIVYQGNRIQVCEVILSAGPAPTGFVEMEDLVSNGNHPAEKHFHEQLRGWREVCWKGTLELNAVQMYVEFWGPTGDRWRSDAPRRAERFGAKLILLLQKSLHLSTFYPTRYQDYPGGWLEVASDRGMVTGRIRKVLRPGLQDDQGRLQIPAVVEVE